MTVDEAYAAWLAACTEAKDIRDRLPVPYMTDNNRSRWFEIKGDIQAQWFDADRARSHAFQAMADSLPHVAPYRWMKWTPARRDHFRAARIWHTEQQRWYPVVETLWTDEDGVDYRVASQMFDDAIAEADRRNIAWDAYYAKKAA